jgi:NADPH:quinone reductase-like Zn-dependent oxidoreductase
MPNPQMLVDLAGAVANGSLRIPITKTYGLDQIGQALKDFESGSLGKIAVAVR